MIVIFTRLFEWRSTGETRRKRTGPGTCRDVGKHVSRASVEQARGEQSGVESV